MQSHETPRVPSPAQIGDSGAVSPALVRLAWLLQIVLVLVLVDALLARWTSAWAFPEFVVLATALVWLPGRFLVDRLRLLPGGGVETLAVGLVLGLSASTVAFLISSLLGYPWLTFVWVLAAAAGTAVHWAPHRRTLATWQPALSLEHGLLALVNAVGLALFALLPQYWRNYGTRSDGSLQVLPFDAAVLHLSVTRELTHGIPPSIPYFPDTHPSFRYGVDAVGAMFVKLGGLGVEDVTLRFLPPLFFLVTSLAIYAFAKRWVRSGPAAALAVALVLFGEDFSFFFGIFRHSGGFWSTQFFQVPAVYSLFTLDPILLGLGVLAMILFCLDKYLVEGGRSWGVVAGCLVAVLWELNVFVVFQLLGALAIAALVTYLRRRELRLAQVLAVAALAVAPLALAAYLRTDARHVTSIGIHPHPYVSRSLEATGFHVADIASGSDRLILLATIALPFFLIGNLGMRLVAVLTLTKRFRLAGDRALRLLLVSFVLLGFLLGFRLSVPLKVDPKGSYDYAIWFLVTSKYVLWILAVEVVALLWTQDRRRASGSLAAALLALSLPSTIQYVWQARRNYVLRSVPAAQVNVLNDLRTRCARGQTVLVDPALERLALSTTRCRVPAPQTYGSLFGPLLLAARPLRQRTNDVDAFWTGWSKGHCLARVVSRYEARYIVPAASSGSPRRCGRFKLELVFRGGGFATLRVVPVAA